MEMKMETRQFSLRNDRVVVLWTKRLCLLLLLMAFCSLWVNARAIDFDMESGRYRKDVTVTLSGADAIIYTLNGDDPSYADFLYYDTPVLLECTDKIQIYPLKARPVDGSLLGDVEERIYVIGREENKLPIVVLTTDASNLYDYQKGILVDGATYDLFGKNMPGDKFGNYMMSGAEWVRPAMVTIFDADGTLMLSQAAGLSTSGGSSRSYNHPSLKVNAEYLGEKEKFYYTGLQNSAYSKLPFVFKLNDIKFRSGSQDADDTNIKSAVMSRLCEQCGFDGYLPNRRCLIYLNREFYGVFDMQVRWIPSFLKRRFGLTSTNGIEIYEETEVQALEAARLTGLFAADLGVLENREALEQQVDMEDYLRYCAIQIISNNVDWPDNNFRMWRYTGPEEDGNKYTDGRYRFLIFDSDLIWLTNEYRIDLFGSDVLVNIMEGLERNDGTRKDKSLIRNVLECEEYRYRFLGILADLLHTTFSRENLEKVIDEEWALISTYQPELEPTTQRMKEKALSREDELRRDALNYFGLSEQFRVNIRQEEGISLVVNGMNISGDYENQYYVGTEVQVRAQADPGYRFLYWLMNGTQITDEVITITADCELIPVAERLETALVIDEISAKGDDWIRLYNAGSMGVNLWDYCLSDRESKPMKYWLPEVELPSGESITIYCDNNDNEGYHCNFNLKELETVCLTNWKAGEMVDKVLIPRYDQGQTYGRLNHGAQFVYYRNFLQRK